MLKHFFSNVWEGIKMVATAIIFIGIMLFMVLLSSLPIVAGLWIFAWMVAACQP